MASGAAPAAADARAAGIVTPSVDRSTGNLDMMRIFRLVLSVLIAAADSGSGSPAAGLYRAALDINIASVAALTAADPCALRKGDRRQLAGIHINLLADAAVCTTADTRTAYAAGRKNLTSIDIRRQRAEIKAHAVSLREILDSDL